MKTILFVEDNPALRESVAEVLQAADYEVLLAEHGREALDILEQTSKLPDLIVSDISMPEMDGYEFRRVIYNDPKTRAIPFMFLTAHGAPHEEREGRLLLVDDYLVKPFQPLDFLIAVQSRIERTEDVREDAESKLEPVRQALVTMIAHELRTPLTYIKGAFELLEDDLKLRQNVSLEDVQLNMDLIRNGTYRLGRLIEQMVIFTELESGVSRQQYGKYAEKVNLYDLVQSIIMDLAHDGRENHKARFVWDDTPEQAVVAYGLLDLIERAIREVLLNARTFAPGDSAIRLSLQRRDEAVALTVQDAGPGILAEDLEKIWEPLGQSQREQQEQQGAGMGLAIVRRVCELHGGGATLDSVFGQGTTVTLTFARAEHA